MNLEALAVFRKIEQVIHGAVRYLPYDDRTPATNVLHDLRKHLDSEPQWQPIRMRNGRAGWVAGFNGKSWNAHYCEAEEVAQYFWTHFIESSHP